MNGNTKSGGDTTVGVQMVGKQQLSSQNAKGKHNAVAPYSLEDAFLNDEDHQAIQGDI